MQKIHPTKTAELSAFWNRICWILWIGLVLALPFSSVPLVAKLTGSSAVAPGSLLFLVPLMLIIIPLMIHKRDSLPNQVKPFLAFVLFALLTIGIGFFRFIPDYKSQTVMRAALEGVLTLMIGFSFFLVSLSIPTSPERLSKTIRLINLAGAILILWSLLQILVKWFLPGLRPIMNEIQSLVSLTRILKTRMVGFAYEPSWLAHMLNLSFLPFWLSATVNRSSAYKMRIWKFTIENLLLVGGIIVLVGTFSRAGLAAFMFVVFFLFVFGNIKLVRILSRKWKVRRRGLLTAAIILTILLIYLILVFSGLFVLSKVDPRMEAVFQVNSSGQSPLIQYADELQFGERMVYWQTGWNIFNDHPLIGVGIGNSGFYFPKYLPDIGWELVESRELLYRSPGLLNIKNLWVRLLAETGIIGFSLYLTFLVITLVTSIRMSRRQDHLQKVLGFAGIFMLIALLLESFSVDSFALPYIWFTLGLVNAGWKWGVEPEMEIHGSI